MVSFEYFKTCPHPVAHWQIEAEEEEISCLEINCNFSSLVHDPDLQQFLYTAILLNSCSDMMCKNENSQKKGRWQKDARLVANGPWPGLHLEMVLAQLTSSLLWHLAFPTMCQYHSPPRTLCNQINAMLNKYSVKQSSWWILHLEKFFCQIGVKR